MNPFYYFRNCECRVENDFDTVAQTFVGHIAPQQEEQRELERIGNNRCKRERQKVRVAKSV